MQKGLRHPRFLWDVGVLFISSYQLNASSSAQLRLPNETISCALTICIKTTSSDYISRKCCCSCSLLIINKVLVNSTALGYSYITFAAIQFVLLRSGFLDLTSLVNYIQEIVVFVYSVVIISLKSLTICVQITIFDSVIALTSIVVLCAEVECECIIIVIISSCLTCLLYTSDAADE